MSFSSLLPAPKHDSDTRARNDEKQNQIHAVHALTGDDDTNQLENVLSRPQLMLASKVSFQDFVPLRQRNFDMKIPKPTQKDINETYTRTLKHFQAILGKASTAATDKKDSITEVTINSRKVKITTQQHDPLQPARLEKARKVYAPVENSEQDQAPQLHVATQTVLSKEERDKWNIPTFVSQWKNPKGYTVDRNGVPTSSPRQISEGFEKLSNALESADRKAREHIKLKVEAKRAVLEEQVKERENKLKSIAASARINKKEHIGAKDRIKREKDMTERIAASSKLKHTSKSTVSYDSRLFVKGAKGRGTSENIYDNPLFVQQDIDSIYRVKKSDSTDTDAIVSSGPIQFTRAERSSKDNESSANDKSD